MPSLDPELVSAVKRGECLLFLGAGVHYPPQAGSIFEAGYPPNVRPPLGKALAKKLAADGPGPDQPSFIAQQFPEESGYEENLARCSALYEMARDRNQLVRYVTGEVDKGKLPSAAVRGLAALPFRLIITTNYDQIFERALGAKVPGREIYDPNRNRSRLAGRVPADADAPLLLKMHGCVTAQNSFVLTEDDYVTFVMRMGEKDPYHPVPKVFKNQFLNWPTLFIGYGLADFNLLLLLKTLSWDLDPAEIIRSYAVSPRPDPVVQRCLGGQVAFIVQDLWGFVPQLYQEVLGKDMPV